MSYKVLINDLGFGRFTRAHHQLLDQLGKINELASDDQAQSDIIAAWQKTYRARPEADRLGVWRTLVFESEQDYMVFLLRFEDTLDEPVDIWVR